MHSSQTLAPPDDDSAAPAGAAAVRGSREQGGAVLRRHYEAWRGCDCECCQQHAAGWRRCRRRDPPRCCRPGLPGRVPPAPGACARCALTQGCATGEAKTTGAYRLPCRAVIHTVGPVYAEHSPAEARRLLQAAYAHSLQQAVTHGLRTVVCMRARADAGVPVDLAGRVRLPEGSCDARGPGASQGVSARRARQPGTWVAALTQIDLVVFCCFSPADLAMYERIAPVYFAGHDP